MQNKIHSDNELNILNTRDAAGLLYANAFAGVSSSMVASSVLAFAFNNPQTKAFSIVWWLVISSIALFRLGDALYWKFSLSKTAFDGKRAQFRFAVGSILTALCWSIYPLALFKQLSLIEFTTTVIIIASLAGGAINTMAIKPRLALSYCLIFFFLRLSMLFLLA